MCVCVCLCIYVYITPSPDQVGLFKNAKALDTSTFRETWGALEKATLNLKSYLFIHNLVDSFIFNENMDETLYFHPSFSSMI